MRVINLLTYPLLALAAAVVLCPLPLNGQSQSLNLRKQAVKAVAEQGMPERGRFEFIYSYSGEAIDATITLTKNGAVLAEQSGLAPVSNATLADLTVKQGDVLVLTSTFNGNASTAVLAPGFFGHPRGLWFGRGSGAFYQVDESSNVIYVLVGFIIAIT